MLPEHPWCTHLRPCNGSSRLQLWGIWEHQLQFPFSFLLISSKWLISASQTSCAPPWNRTLWKKITLALKVHTEEVGKGKVAKSISLGICTSKDRSEGAAHKADGRTSILQRFYFRTEFHVYMHDKDTWVPGTSSADGQWWGLPGHCLQPLDQQFLIETIWLTFVELVDWRKVVCGNGKWAEHNLVWEERQSFWWWVWRRPVAEFCRWKSFCALRKCIKWRARSSRWVPFELPRSPSFIKVQPSIPSGYQTRQKIFNSTSISKVPKSPGLNLLFCIIWCWP